MDFHFANLWEAIAGAIPGRPALVHDGVTRSWAAYDDRAARFAAALSAAGLKPGSKFGLYLTNGPEYLEAQFGGFKMRGVPVNVNYRYLEDELVYLLDNSDSEALVFHAAYAGRVDAIRRRLPRIGLYVQVTGDGAHAAAPAWAHDYEALLRDHPPTPRCERPGADIYMLYTGGTTGMPKGVMYTHAQTCSGLLLGYAFRGMEPPVTVEAAAAKARELAEAELAPRSLVCCPLMHGTGMWVGSMIALNMGGTVITMPGAHFDPDKVWQTVERERPTDVTIVGDAFAKPLLRALEAAASAGKPYDISSVKIMASSGVMWTREVKEGLLKFADLQLADLMGSTEGGMGSAVSSRAAPPATARFALNANVKVFADDGREVPPGSGEMGKIATAGNVPLGYYKDPAKSAETFREIGGIRYSFPGDYATVEADGTITLLGRGSQVINTGGEKVFPEEVEEALKRHEAVEDCLVVGLPDDRFGQRVSAVVSLRGEATESAVLDAARKHLAGYKLPKQIVFVPAVQRAPNGKADYRWARERLLNAFADR